MRHSHAATLAALTAGLTAAVALHRRADRRRTAPATATAATTAPPAATDVAPAPVAPVLVRDGVVLPFVRPVPAAPAVEQPAVPARCGDSGGRTKSGAPCAARATSAGRCHHHPLAA